MRTLDTYQNNPLIQKIHISRYFFTVIILILLNVIANAQTSVITGPEKGTLFSIGKNSSGTREWNDLGTGNSIGYVVEYGGLLIDPVQSISSNTALSTLITTNTATASQTLCNGGGTAAAFIGSTPTGGNGTYSYSWLSSTTSASTGFAVASGASTSINYSPGFVTVNTWYKRVVTSGTLMDTTTALSITIASAISATTSQTNISCNGLTDGIAGVYNMSGGTTPYSYLWDFGGTNDVESSLGTGTYTCTITDANSCTLENVFTITEPFVLSASLSSTDVLCNGGSSGTATVIPSGGTSPYTYNWSDGSSSNTASGLNANNYSVTITDNNGCQFNDSISVAEPNILSISISKTNSTCSSLANGVATASSSGGTSPYTYEWSTGEATASISSLAAGTYSVTVTDSHNCKSNSFISLTNNYSLTSTISSTNVSCNGGNNGSATILPSGGTSPYSYVWNNGDLTSVISLLSAQLFSVTITDANGCTSINSVTVTQPQIITTSITQTNVTCYGTANGTATIVVAGGTSPYNYSWTSGDTTAITTALDAQNYSVQIIDANGCTQSASVLITEPISLTVTTSSNDVLCNAGNSGSAMVTGVDGTAPYAYVWSTGGVANMENNLAAGTYTVTVTDANGCSSEGSVIISEPDVLVLTVSGVAANCGQSNGSASVVVSGGSGPFMYNWSSGGTADIENNLAAGNYSISVTDVNGCSQVNNVLVSNSAALSVAVSQTSVLCNGDNNGTIDLSVTGGSGNFTYLWSNGDTTSSVSGLSPISYSYIVTDAANCQSTGVVIITQPDLIVITSTTINETISNDGSIDLTVSGGVAPYTFSWSDGSSTEDLLNLASGNYTVTITDSYGCIHIETITVGSSVGINQHNLNTTFDVYPNPNNGKFTIKGNHGINLTLKNSLGQIVKRIQLTSNNLYAISVENLSAGVYFIQNEKDTSQTMKKIVVIK